MERIHVVLLVVMVLASSGIKSTAGSFQSCYGPCFLLCAITPDTTLSSCALQCLKQCIISYISSPPSSSPSLVRDDRRRSLHYYCKLGCAASLCTNISTRGKPDGEAVEGCVKTCSDLCTNHHH
ncbi:hypothetical protein Sjap_019414 [Stephania japonica]|uniref:Thionin-like protein 2 n=1 Tax=Stephania japonica TaxID=461633 RepID=A0AAP0EYQ3_9MAGN